MRLYKGVCLSAVTMVFCVFAANGCNGTQKEAAKKPAEANKLAPQAVTAEEAAISLRFVPKDVTKYKVIMEGQRKVKWEGTVPEKAAFESGETINRMEMAFTQKIQGVESNGNAIAVITVDGLKYLYKIKENVILDFDSTRAVDANNPMKKLVGQSYTIEITPSGQAAKVIDVNEAQTAVTGNLSAQKAALKLLEPEVIKERHGTLVLPDAEKNQLRNGENWSSVKTFSFGLMGSASYRRVYTLKGVENIEGRQTATVEMKAEPTSETAEETHKEQATKDLSKGFDNKGEYGGELKFDLTSGKVKKFSEELRIEWVTARPAAKKEGETEPTALVMSATRSYSIEKIE